MPWFINNGGDGGNPISVDDMYSFDIKSAEQDTLDHNGVIMLNNWSVGSMRNVTVSPDVSYFKVMPWDAGQSSDSYSEITLPINEDGSETVVLNYKTNNIAHIFRNRNSSGSPYQWELMYDGYTDRRIDLPNANGETYDMIGALTTFQTSHTIFNVTAMDKNIDKDLTVYVYRPSSMTSLELYLKNVTASGKYFMFSTNGWRSTSSFYTRSQCQSIGNNNEGTIPFMDDLRDGNGADVTVEIYNDETLSILYKRYRMVIFRTSSTNINFSVQAEEFRSLD